MAAKGKFVMYPGAMRRVLQEDKRYGLYMEHVGNEIRQAAIATFLIFNRFTNEADLSEFTPPKYLASFRVHTYRKLLITEIENQDPGWALVEWGAHPGGDPTTFVLRYKPLTRGLLIVAARGRF